MMIAAIVAAALHHRRAAKLAAPEHERVVEQAALFQIAHQRGAGLIGVLAVLGEVLLEIAVLVPGFVEQLHETHAALEQAPGQQAVVGERRLARLGAVHVENVLRLPRQVHQFRGAGLHAIGHLERVDARGDFRIADHIETGAG